MMPNALNLNVNEVGLTPGPEEHVMCMSFAPLPTIKKKADYTPCPGIGKRCRGKTAYARMQERRLSRVKETAGYLSAIAPTVL